MEEKIFTLYDNIKNYKFVERYLNDINDIYDNMVDYDRTNASYITSFYLQKYYKTLKEIGKISGGIRLVYDNNIYKSKSDTDIIYDMYFCIMGIFCEAYITLGFAKNIKDFVINFMD